MKNYIGTIYKDMMDRCYNTKSIMYHNYGGIGIKVCEEWHDREAFDAWARANGYHSGVYLRRKDTKSDYSPDNCYFFEKETNSNESKKKENTTEITKTVYQKEVVEKTIRRYGLKESDNPLYPTYAAMKKRCTNPNGEKFKTYGAKGITLCDDWNGDDGCYNFTVWALNNGWKKGLTLDRIDNNRGYYPANCRWVSKEEQQSNTKRDYKIFYNGETKKIRDIERETGIDHRVLYKGIVSCGLAPETVISVALTTLEYKKIKEGR